jgi:hypothetical protein
LRKIREDDAWAQAANALDQPRGEGTAAWTVKNTKTGQTFGPIRGQTPMDAKQALLASQPMLGRGHPKGDSKVTAVDLSAYPFGSEDPSGGPAQPQSQQPAPDAPAGSPRRHPRAKLQPMTAQGSDPGDRTAGYRRPDFSRPVPNPSGRPERAPLGAASAQALGQKAGRSSRFTRNEPFSFDDDETTLADPPRPVADTGSQTVQTRAHRPGASMAARMGDTDVDVPAVPSVAKHRARDRGMRDEGMGAAAMGANGPMGDNDPKKEAFKEAVRQMVREIVREKEGGGGYKLYPPNKGKKKKNQKAVGDFPTRFSAKKAELARFPPKDPEQLKKMRARIDKLSKDPKKRADAERRDLTGKKKPRKSGAPARERKKRKEEFVRLMAQDLHERLFHDEEVPGSPWDEQMSSLHPDAISSDRKLHSLHRGMEKASIGALGDAHKGLSKALRGIVKVHPGDIAFDDERKQNCMPVMLDCDGYEIGPVHLYIDGGHVKVELSKDARQAIAQLEPDTARDLRGGLMSFEEDHLPKIDGAQRAWRDRDSYLDRLHGKLSKHAAGLSGVEHHILKGLLTKGGKRK